MLLRNRAFALLWVAGLVSLTGNWVLFVGLPLSVFKLTGSTLAIGAVLAATMTPRVLFASIAG